MSEMISVHGISKRYGEIEAVKKISFSINSGEIVGFLGPNGAGKTTTMKMITGYIQSDEGNIKINGKPLSSPDIRNEIGYLPENNPLYTDMTVDEYLTFIAHLRGVQNQDAAKKVAMSKCGITDVSHRLIGQLSKGYRQRVGLAQAIIHDPKILILDEPVNGLDPKQIMEIRTLIRMLGSEKTVILSSHILSEIEAVANRVIIINNGTISADGNIESLKQGSHYNTVYKMEFLEKIDLETVRNRLKSMLKTEFVDIIDDYSLKIGTQKDKTFGNELYKLAIHFEWPLTQLAIESSSLENLFLNITDGGN